SVVGAVAELARDGERLGGGGAVEESAVDGRRERAARRARLVHRHERRDGEAVARGVHGHVAVGAEERDHGGRVAAAHRVVREQTHGVRHTAEPGEVRQREAESLREIELARAEAGGDAPKFRTERCHAVEPLPRGLVGSIERREGILRVGVEVAA
ncbi:MAG: hypothetical protein ACK56I_17690, partial [bacterium]